VEKWGLDGAPSESLLPDGYRPCKAPDPPMPPFPLTLQYAQAAANRLTPWGNFRTILENAQRGRNRWNRQRFALPREAGAPGRRQAIRRGVQDAISRRAPGLLPVYFG